jgi:hypothetical protein
MGQGLPKNHKKYKNDFCSANNCKKCLIVEINFIAKMSSSFGPWVSQCELLIKVFSCMTFQNNYFSHFCAINAEFRKDFNHCGFPKAAF